MRPIYHIAGATIRDLLRKPASYVLFAFVLILLYLGDVLAFFAFTDEDKWRWAIDLNMASILLYLLLMAILYSSGLIFDDIKRKTALSILSKPVGRISYLTGRYLGIFTILLSQAIFLSLFFLFLVWFKMRNLEEVPIAISNLNVIKGCGLAFCQSAIVAAVGIVLSTTFDFTKSALLTLVCFVLGNQVSFILEISQEASFINRIFAKIYSLLPNFDLFNKTYAVALSKNIPNGYFFTGIFYAMVYIVALIFIGNWILSRRDLA